MNWMVRLDNLFRREIPLRRQNRFAADWFFAANTREQTR
jgi:hypothetical protein